MIIEIGQPMTLKVCDLSGVSSLSDPTVQTVVITVEGERGIMRSYNKQMSDASLLHIVQAMDEMLGEVGDES